MKKKTLVSQLKPHYQETANNNLKLCEQQLEKMQKGLLAINDDPHIKKAFLYANYSILLQMHMGRTVREPLHLSHEGKINYSREYQNPEDALNQPKYSWRPFQIGFILSSLTSFAEQSTHFSLDQRKDIDLIFFPTGGGRDRNLSCIDCLQQFLQKINQY